MTEMNNAPGDLDEAAAAQDASLGDAAGTAPADASKSHHGRKHRHGRRRHGARIEHSIAGRIRIKVPAGRGDAAVLQSLGEAIASGPGVRSVEHKPDTGSIVILFDPRHEAAMHDHLDTHMAIERDRPGDEISEIAHKIEAEAAFLAQRSELARVTVDAFKALDRELKTVTDNTIDMKVVLAGGLAAFTFLEIGAEAATPMWVTLALFSLNHFVELQSHPHQPAPTMPAAREAAARP